MSHDHDSSLENSNPVSVPNEADLCMSCICMIAVYTGWHQKSLHAMKTLAPPTTTGCVKSPILVYSICENVMFSID